MHGHTNIRPVNGLLNHVVLGVLFCFLPLATWSEVTKWQFSLYPSRRRLSKNLIELRFRRPSYIPVPIETERSIFLSRLVYVSFEDPVVILCIRDFESLKILSDFWQFANSYAVTRVSEWTAASVLYFECRDENIIVAKFLPVYRTVGFHIMKHVHGNI